MKLEILGEIVREAQIRHIYSVAGPEHTQPPESPRIEMDELRIMRELARDRAILFIPPSGKGKLHTLGEVCNILEKSNSHSGHPF